jgi:hypothetical protein
MVTISTRREVAIASSPDQQPRPQLEVDDTADQRDQRPRPQLEAEDTVEVPIKQTETKVDKLAQ